MIPGQVNRTLKTQVVIVGAGPTGLGMAVQLLRYGIDFILIEKKQGSTSLSKAIVVQARTLEIFQELGLAEKAIEEGQVTMALNLFHKGKQKAFIDLAGLGEGLSPFPFALSLEQSKTEKLLAGHLSANGAQIQWGCTFTGFRQREDGVTVYYTDSKEQEQKIECAYLVGCDGASSLVRHQMGLSFEGDTVPKLFYVADVLLKSPVIHTNELFMFLIKKGFILFFPMEGKGHYRIVGILPNAGIADEQLRFADVENDIKKQIVSPVDFEELRWFSTYKVHSRKARSFSTGRCFIAGDAAHIHTPAGGQGMNTGIQDAYNLAWKLAYTLTGEADGTILNTYSAEREENAKHLLQTTDRMFDIMAGTKGWQNFIRLHFLPAFVPLITKIKALKKRIFPLVSQTAISYTNSDLTMDSSIGKVKAGVRMPYFIFSDGKTIFDYVTEPAFRILFFGDGEKKGTELFNDIKIRMKVHSFKEIPFSLFGRETDFYILLRPDNHISYIGKDVMRCREILQKIAAKT